MTAEELAAIKARAAAAAMSPWTCDSDAGGFRYAIPEAELFTDPDYAIPTAATMAFVAHSRDDVLALVAEVERLRAALEAIVQRELDGWGGDSDLCCVEMSDLARQALRTEVGG